MIDWERLRAAVSEHIDAGEAPGAVLAVSSHGDVNVETVGAAAMGGAGPLAGDAIVRISSMTKPIAAVVTLMLIEDGALGLHAPIERWVPELADRRVLRRLDGSLDDTVPADRPITVEDLLTLRMGFGFVFDTPCPVLDRAVAAGLGFGPPDPSLPLTPDEWLARFAELPLMHQPGADWMYEFGFGVLAVVLARAAGKPLDDLFRELLFTPLGMTDTGFEVPARTRPRLIPCYTKGDDGLTPFDGVNESRWNQRPMFPDARGGLVSTAADYLRFARLLLDGGVFDGARLLSEDSVAAMCSDHLGAQRARSASADIFLSEGAGWGYGVEVFTAAHAGDVNPVRYGWGGGLGTTWYSSPRFNTAAVLLTQCLPPPEPLVSAFWSTLLSMIEA